MVAQVTISSKGLIYLPSYEMGAAFMDVEYLVTAPMSV